jgi:hypothetical protein
VEVGVQDLLEMLETLEMQDLLQTQTALIACP